MNSKSKKKSPVVLIASISLLLIAAILGTVYYKYGSVIQKREDQSMEQQETKGQTNPETNEQIAPTPEPKPSTTDGSSNEPKSSDMENDETNTTIEVDDVEVENGYIVGQQPATEPTFVQGVLIVNKKNPLPPTYNKGEDPKAKAALEKMAAAAKNEGFELVAFSGFRSYEYQQTLYDRYVSRDGKDAADRYSARPGYSEHQSGLAFDVGEKGKEDLWLTSAFGESPAGKWLVDNAHKYGFILRYPKGKEDITGYMYESWHFRYLEGDIATKVYEAGVTLEEYLGLE